MSVTSALNDIIKIPKTGRQIKSKVTDKVRVLEKNESHPDIEELELLKVVVRNIEDSDIFILSIEQCYELGF